MDQIMMQLLPHLLEQSPTLTAVALAVWWLGRKSAQAQVSAVKQQSHESRLADSIDALTKKLDGVVRAIEHMDGRLDAHDVAIARLEERGHA